MKKIPLEGLLELLTAEPPSDEDEGRQILKAYFDRAHQIVLGPYPGTTASADVIDRHRLIGLLELTITLLRGIGAGDQLFNKLMIYSAALRDLDQGVTSPILKARARSHAAPLSSESWRLRAILAVALDYLVLAGEPLEDAARVVARTPGIKRLLSRQARDAKTSIKKWRGSLHRGTATNDAARMAWRASREKVTSIDGPQGFRDEAARLMAVARDELR